MTLVGRIADPRLAQAFVDYMAVHKVHCQIQPHEGDYGILCAESDVDRVRSEFIKFAEDPLHKRYRSASWHRTDPSQIQFDYGASGLPLLHQVWVQAGPVTLAILMSCLALSLASFLGLGNWLFSWLHFPAPFDQQWSQIWRLWTPAVFHVEPIHLLFNLVWWWYLGGRIERELGSGTLLLLLLFGALLSNALQGFWVGPNFLGLSGVVYALLGYITVMQKVKPGLAVPPMYIGFMLVWLVLGFADVLGMNMANLAHLGGLLVGFAQGWMDRRTA